MVSYKTGIAMAKSRDKKRAREKGSSDASEAVENVKKQKSDADVEEEEEAVNAQTTTATKPVMDEEKAAERDRDGLATRRKVIVVIEEARLEVVRTSKVCMLELLVRFGLIMRFHVRVL